MEEEASNQSVSLLMQDLTNLFRDICQWENENKKINLRIEHSSRHGTKSFIYRIDKFFGINSKLIKRRLTKETIRFYLKVKIYFKRGKKLTVSVQKCHVDLSNYRFRAAILTTSVNVWNRFARRGQTCFKGYVSECLVSSFLE